MSPNDHITHWIHNLDYLRVVKDGFVIVVVFEMLPETDRDVARKVSVANECLREVDLVLV